jgi:hypothetical protein
MCFRLGDIRPEDLGIDEYEALNPFKTKGPLKGWYIVSGQDRWSELAILALEQMWGG